MQLADPSFASPILGWLATFLIHSTLWIGGAWLVARRVDSATWRERLWRGSIAGGFATSLLVLALPTASFGWSWEMPAREAASSSIDGIPSAAAAPQVQAHDAPATLELAPPSETSAPTIPVPHERPAARWSWPSLTSALLGLWLAGAAIGLAQLAWAYARLASVLRSRRPLEAGKPMEAMQRIASLAGLRGCPRLSTSSSLASPIALARGEIVVPERALKRLGAPELESLLGHELAHLARRDPWWLLALNVLRRVLWIQPLLSLATARAIEAAELRCDELSARWTRGELALARCLAEVATWIEGRPATRLVAGMAEQPSALVERVERLLNPRRAARGQAIIVSCWLAATLTGLACGGPEVQPAAPPAPHPEERLDQASADNSAEAQDEVLVLDRVAVDLRAELMKRVAESLQMNKDAVERQRLIDMADLSKLEALVGSSLHTTRSEQDGQPTLTARPHILHLHADGSIDCAGAQLVAPGSVDDTELKQHLESIAAGMPTSRANPSVPPFPLGPLIVRADASTSHAQLHRVLQLNAGPDVGIRMIELGIAGGTPMALESAGEPVAEGLPLPDGVRIAIFAPKASVATSAPLGQRLSYKLERQQTAYRTNVSGYVGTGDLEDLRSKLREFHAEVDGRLPVSLDAAPEVLCSEVLAVAAVAREVGFERIVLAVAPQEE